MPSNKSKKREPNESQIETALYNWTCKQGLLNYKFSSPSHRGVPDRMIINQKGKILFLELKAPYKKPTSLQLYEIDKLRSVGLNAEWASTFGSAKAIVSRVLL